MTAAFVGAVGPSDREVVVLEAVSHRFGDHEVLRSVDLQIERGDVYGLIGLNGAGKTTTLRILLRFLRRQQGRVALFGLSQDEHWLDVAGRIGATIEAPAFYPHLTGRTNLELLFQLSGVRGGRGPSEALDLVGLAHAADRRTADYSQGMKQRLYLAQALLGRPELLVLDEPTSNLDPRGILEVRTLIQRLNRESGLTVILSSHQLTEVEGLCNRVAVLHEGKRIAESSVEELFDDGQSAVEVEVEVDHAGRALEVLRKLSWAEGLESGEGWVRVSVSRERRAELNALLVAAGVGVSRLEERRPSLEDYFYRMVSDDA
jgi:ABC-2 type transport system ATP-binding protein